MWFCMKNNPIFIVYKKYMDHDINLVLRSKIIYSSLQIENAINNLLVKHLLILDKSKTKNFGNKAGISFQSKIDLLYDIDVLDKSELNDIALLMNFRNKFLHDIKYSSFTILLGDLDNGIKNRFFTFMNNVEEKNEDNYDQAFMNLYGKIVEIINSKIETIDKVSNEKIEFFKFQNEFISSYIIESLDFCSDITELIDQVEDIELKDKLINRLNIFQYKMDYEENITKFKNLISKDIIKSLLKKH